MQLREMVRDAARPAFAAVRRRQPGERFYAFALQSLDDASGVYAHANTEEGYQRTLAKARARPWPVEERYQRWYWGEWDHQNIEVPSFRGVYEFIAKKGREETDSPDQWQKFRGVVFAAMVAALADLDEEGAFGRGAEREQVTLFCTVEDSWCNDWVEDESAARLNPREAYRGFARAPVQMLSPDKSVREAFVCSLDEWGLARRAASDDEVVAELTSGGHAVADFFFVAGVVCFGVPRGGLVARSIDDPALAAATEAYLRRMGAREYGSYQEFIADRRGSSQT